MNTITKRPGYSIMRETPAAERGRELANLIKTNPKALRYFMKRNSFVRVFEIGKMVVSTEAHSRKESLRSSLYVLAEPYLKDGKMRDVNIEGIVKATLSEAKASIMAKPARTAEDMASVAVMDELLKKENEIEASKILNDKEKWWRRVLRTLTAAALGAALMFNVAPKPVEKPPQPAAVAEDCTKARKSLNICIEALQNSEFLECKPKVQREVIKEKEVNLDEVCAGRVQQLAKDSPNKDETIKALEEEIKKLKGDSKRWNEFKLYFMKKVDTIFASVGPEDEADKNYYKVNVRPWFENAIDNDDPVMIKMVINMGGELLCQKLEGKNVKSLATCKTSSEFTNAAEKGNLTYPYGTAGDFNKWNKKGDNKQALFKFYKELYENLVNLENEKKQ